MRRASPAGWTRSRFRCGHLDANRAPGDRVLTTPISAFATTLAIVKLGAVPVFVDTDDQGLIDLRAVP